MKKVLIIFLSILLLVGCTQTPNLPSVEPNVEDEVVIEYDRDYNVYFCEKSIFKYTNENIQKIENMVVELTKKNIGIELGSEIDIDPIEFEYFVNDNNEVEFIQLQFNPLNMIEYINYHSIYIIYNQDKYVFDNSNRYEFNNNQIKEQDISKIQNGEIIQLSFSLKGMQKIYQCEKNNNEWKIIKQIAYKDYEEENALFNVYSMYHLSDEAKNDIKNIVMNHPKIQYYLQINNYKEVKIKYKNKLEIFADDDEKPFFVVWMNPHGVFNYEYNFNYNYDFSYVKNNETRNAHLCLMETKNINPEYSAVDLVANNQKFSFRYNKKELYSSTTYQPIIFTPDLQEKILNYYDEYFEKGFNNDVLLFNSIMNIMIVKGEEYAFEPFQMDECIDSRIQVFDSIKPLINRNCNSGNTNNLTPYYIVEIGNAYGLVNEKHEVVIPIRYKGPFQVWFNEILFGTEYNTPNHTIYKLSGGFGGAYTMYMHDGDNAYLYSVGDDGPASINKIELDAPLSNHSIPVKMIKNFEIIKVENDFETYTYDILGFGLMNEKGQLISSSIYETMANVVDDYVYAKKNGKYGFLNTKGNEIIPFIYDDAMYVYHEQAIVKKDGKYGAINMQNEIIIDFNYNQLSYFGENCYVGLQNDVWEIIYL